MTKGVGVPWRGGWEYLGEGGGGTLERGVGVPWRGAAIITWFTVRGFLMAGERGIMGMDCKRMARGTVCICVQKEP